MRSAQMTESPTVGLVKRSKPATGRADSELLECRASAAGRQWGLSYFLPAK